MKENTLSTATTTARKAKPNVAATTKARKPVTGSTKPSVRKTAANPLGLDLTKRAAYVIAVGPEIAEALLENNDGNRSLKPGNLERIRRAMESGNFTFGSSIQLEKDTGRLLDGQHRLLETARTGTTHDFVVVTGAERAGQRNTDTGAPRTLRDRLEMDYKVPSSLSLHVQGLIKVSHAWARGSFVHDGDSNMLPIEEDRWFEAHPELVDVARRAESFRKRSDGLLSTKMVGILMWYFDRLDGGKEDCEAFFDRLATGEMLARNTPIYVLRNTLAKAKAKVRKSDELDSRGKLAAVVNAWNMWRTDAEMNVTNVKVQLGGHKAQPFPEPM